MKTRSKAIISALILLLVILLGYVILHGANFQVLNPAGQIASKQMNLMIFAALLSLVVVIPVFIMAFTFSWKYREGKHAKYSPNLDSNIFAEITWWAIPTILIVILSVVTWKSTHDLDPFKPISSNTKPMTIQVVALDWKWLFIYPEQNIASVNQVNFPEKTPIKFVITADAPMNSFWIPQLGGQIYAMSGMSTNLNLEASGVGSYRGSSANLSGEGFSGMRFKANSMTKEDFNDWVKSAKKSPESLTSSEYQELTQPSKNNPVQLYSSKQPGLYDSVIEKYMPYGHNMENMRNYKSSNEAETQ